MSFEQLHPAIQHHVVNSLGWTSLRPLQEESIGPILAGEDAIIVGPTAGGKTEAAALPIMSRILTEDWTGLSTLWVSPLRALANDTTSRLHALGTLLGRASAVWHGDVGPSTRKAILREPPDVLVTTPESLEVMLVSRKVDHARLFRELKAVVIDEVHSFGSDDRGWHLLAVLARIERLVGRRLQRVGLSATVGNPTDVLTWLQGESTAPRTGSEIQGRGEQRRNPELRADYVGNLGNAATVTASLHNGEKRLVFCDSRADVESFASRLRGSAVETYVSHSSLSRDERRRAERAFAEGSNCVIVATSTLELGIDVGDLDRVIQVDAPNSVASFLQRMGRTGRRPGTQPNTLFLTTRPETLLRALGLVLLWSRGFVEKVSAPTKPLHIVGQQLLAICLQEGHVGRRVWAKWIEAAGLASEGEQSEIAEFMHNRGFIEEDEGMFFIGEAAERNFGHRHFMELVSVFTTPPLVEVRHGRQHLGSVHETSFMTREDAAPVLLLAGRGWSLDHVDWKRRVAQVLPAEDSGRSRWVGSGQPISFTLARAMRDVVTGDEAPVTLSNRARAQLSEIRAELAFINRERTVLATRAGRTRWWTFAGTLANRELEWRLEGLTETSRGADEYSVPVREGATIEALEAAKNLDPPGDSFPIDREAMTDLKFSDCLPEETATSILRARLRDVPAVEETLREPTRRTVS